MKIIMNLVVFGNLAEHLRYGVEVFNNDDEEQVYYRMGYKG